MLLKFVDWYLFVGIDLAILIYIVNWTVGFLSALFGVPKDEDLNSTRKDRWPTWKMLMWKGIETITWPYSVPISVSHCTY